MSRENSHETFLFWLSIIAYAQKPPTNANADLSSNLNFDPRLRLHQHFVYAPKHCFSFKFHKTLVLGRKSLKFVFIYINTLFVNTNSERLHANVIRIKFSRAGTIKPEMMLMKHYAPKPLLVKVS